MSKGSRNRVRDLSTFQSNYAAIAWAKKPHTPVKPHPELATDHSRHIFLKTATVEEQARWEEKGYTLEHAYEPGCAKVVGYWAIRGTPPSNPLLVSP